MCSLPWTCPRTALPAHLQIPLAFMILLDPVFYKDTIWAGNDFSTLVMAISAGYFLYDTLEVRTAGYRRVVVHVVG